MFAYIFTWRVIRLVILPFFSANLEWLALPSRLALVKDPGSQMGFLHATMVSQDTGVWRICQQIHSRQQEVR